MKDDESPRSADSDQVSWIPPDQLRRFWRLPVVMLGVRDYDGWYVHASVGHWALLGWSADELRSAPFWEFLHPADQHEMVESSQALMDDEAGLRLGYQVRMLCRDGSYRWTRWNTATEPAEQLFYGVGMDISDLKPPIVDHTTVGTWQWDIPGNAVTWSAELAELLALPAGVATSGYETFLGAVHPEDRTSVDRSLRWSLTSGEAIAVTFRVPHQAGAVVHLHMGGRITMSTNGDPTHAAGIGRQTT